LATLDAIDAYEFAPSLSSFSSLCSSQVQEFPFDCLSSFAQDKIDGLFLAYIHFFCGPSNVEVLLFFSVLFIFPCSWNLALATWGRPLESPKTTFLLRLFFLSRSYFFPQRYCVQDDFTFSVAEQSFGIRLLSLPFFLRLLPH